MGSAIPQDDRLVEGVLLCLKCRLPGHVVEECPSSFWQPELYWTFSPARKYFSTGDGMRQNRLGFCDRCIALDILSFLHEPVEWISRDTLNKAANDHPDKFRVIGKTGSIKYWTDCSLCRCLFALTPNPSSTEQEVVLVPYWTIFRLEGAVVIDSDQKRRYSKCLMITLRPSSSGIANMQYEDRVTRGDALCLLDDHRIEDNLVLGGRRIEHDRISMDLVSMWLSSCQQRHSLTCTPQWVDALRSIKLLDVSDGSALKLVSAPNNGCEYIALSYVWGDIEKQSFKLGPVQFQSLPRTIQDAIDLVRQLGKSYLWVDLVCVDQLDEEDKRVQIERMAAIYRGAFATIIAISGPSAKAGLPRVGSAKTTASQLQCEIDGRRMVGLMPTLSQLIWISPWGQRAWTLQEALLSRRCIYLSEYQAYFECNAMQCSESLDESRSPIHRLDRDLTTDQTHANIGGGCLRHELTKPGVGKEHFLHAYASRLVLYSYRSMTESRDAINALSGIIQDWQEDYGVTFYTGLPIQYLQWGLLWTAQSGLKRRPEFPTWSWAGWQGPICQRLPFDVSRPDPLPSYLFIRRISQSRLQPLFPSAANLISSKSDLRFLNDPIAQTGRQLPSTAKLDISQYPNAERDAYLIVDGIILHFNPQRGRNMDGDMSSLDLPSQSLTLITLDLAGVSCIVRMNISDPALAERAFTEHDFLLVTRQVSDGWVHHWLLLLEFQGLLATRVSTVLFSVPEVYIGVLVETFPQSRKFILA